MNHRSLEPSIEKGWSAAPADAYLSLGHWLGSLVDETESCVRHSRSYPFDRVSIAKDASEYELKHRLAFDRCHSVFWTRLLPLRLPLRTAFLLRRRTRLGLSRRVRWHAVLVHRLAPVPNLDLRPARARLIQQVPP